MGICVPGRCVRPGQLSMKAALRSLPTGIGVERKPIRRGTVAAIWQAALIALAPRQVSGRPAAR